MTSLNCGGSDAIETAVARTLKTTMGQPVSEETIARTAIDYYRAALNAKRITHGRHCTCSACEREDWTNADLAPCGMHGSGCPALYQPWGNAGSYV